MRKIIVMICCGICLAGVSSVEARPHKASATKVKQKKYNGSANKYRLTRIKDLAQLKKFIEKKLLIFIPDTDAYVLDSDQIGQWDQDNKVLYYYARPYVKDLLDTEPTACHAQTGDVYSVASLVRTRAYQKTLHDNDHKAGAIVGKKLWKQSAHLTGAAVDISYKGLSEEGKSCLRERLHKREKQGQIIVLYEKSHFHIMVLSNYKK